VAILGKKTGERRTIPLTHKAFEVLKDKEKIRTRVRSIGEDLVFTHPFGQRVNIYTLRSAFEDALKRAKIEKFRFHDLRHTFATRLVQAGVNLYVVKELLGHKSLTMTMRYAHHNTESLRYGVDVLDKIGYSLVTVGDKTDSVDRPTPLPINHLQVVANV